VVTDPSAHDAWVDGIYESVNYEWKDGALVESKEEEDKKAMDEAKAIAKKSLSKRIDEDKTESQIKAFGSFMDKLRDF